MWIDNVHESICIFSFVISLNDHTFRRPVFETYVCGLNIETPAPLSINWEIYVRIVAVEIQTLVLSVNI